MDLKNKLLTGLFAIALAGLSACSSSQVDENGAPLESEGESTEVAEATTDEAPADDAGLDAPAEVSGDAPTDTVVAASDEPVNLDTAPEPALDAPPPVDAGVTAMTDAPPTSNTNTEVPVDTQMVASEPAPVTESGPIAAVEPPSRSSKSSMSGDGMAYTVRRGDTLMKIAFENYGDLYRWREIYEANRNQIQDPNQVPPGTQLTLNGAGMVTIERNGEQYLIKGGDTLGTISNDVYGTTRKWKRLWENNRQLIKDPNKIYAGFYLYYQPDGKLTRDASTEDMGAQAAPAEAPAEQVVQEAQPAAPNVATAPAAVDARAPASAPGQ
jgi:nucleoid-associated protein YgaU